MGKIFGISDLPVSTIMTPFEPIIVHKDPTSENIEKPDKIVYNIIKHNYTQVNIYR